jgi:hypothetical protein
MNLMLNIPADLEVIIRKRAEEAGLELDAYVLQTLRVLNIEAIGSQRISDEQFATSLDRIRQIHFQANPNFDDTRESIYEGCGE